MIRKSVSLSLCLWLTSVWAVDSISISNKIETVEGRPYFQSHDEWVGLPLAFAPVEQVRKDLEKMIGKTLQHRGEAHVTVITPPEWRTLSQYIKMDVLDKLVVKEKMMSVKLKVKCLKKVTATIKGKTEESWFIAVDAPELKEYRNQAWRLYVGAGGLPEDFNWKRWSPHITVGYTSQDLHDEDKVSKEKADCVIPLKTI